MGMYIETDSSRNKAAFLLNKHNAEVMQTPAFLNEASGKITVCVIDNGPFEAAGICTHKREFEAFNQPYDDRDKIWLAVPRDEVFKLNPYAKELIDEVRHREEV